MKIEKIKNKMSDLRAWFKENWVSAVLDLSMVVLACFIGLLIGGFLGFIFVINALIGA